MCYRTGTYIVCRSVRAYFSSEILRAGAMKGLMKWPAGRSDMYIYRFFHAPHHHHYHTNVHTVLTSPGAFRLSAWECLPQVLSILSVTIVLPYITWFGLQSLKILFVFLPIYTKRTDVSPRTNNNHKTEWCQVHCSFSSDDNSLKLRVLKGPKVSSTL